MIAAILAEKLRLGSASCVRHRNSTGRDRPPSIRWQTEMGEAIDQIPV